MPLKVFICLGLDITQTWIDPQMHRDGIPTCTIKYRSGCEGILQRKSRHRGDIRCSHTFDTTRDMGNFAAITQQSRPNDTLAQQRYSTAAILNLRKTASQSKNHQRLRQAMWSNLPKHDTFQEVFQHHRWDLLMFLDRGTTRTPSRITPDHLQDTAPHFKFKGR